MLGTVAITNVKVFDGSALTGERTVVMDHGVIANATNATSADTVVDGQHGTLLPGLIDSHVHLRTVAELEQGTYWGCTTLLDMASSSMTVIDSLRHRAGLADIRSAGCPASAPGGMQTTRMGFPAASAVIGPADASRFVADRVAEGSDYIKVIVEDPQRMGSAALDGPTIAALVQAAHQAGLKTIAHVTTLAALTTAAAAGVDVLTHVPLDAGASEQLARAIATRGAVSAPTLTMMRAVASVAERLPTHAGSHSDYANARSSVTAFHQAGVTILAGTDANQGTASPAQVPHGQALHDELALLVEAGLTPVEALRSATVIPAAYWEMADRGAIEAGRRADLLLIDGDPTQDIATTRAIRGVWAAGVRVR